MFNLANKLTLLRIAAVPLLVFLLYFPNRVTCWIALVIFIAAALTDMVDGMVARRQALVSNLGKFLDPLADKLLICSVLVMLVMLSWAPAWVAVLIIARELMVTGLRAMAADKGLVIAADRYGKLKTILQIVALCPLILHFPLGSLDPRPIGEVLLYIALALTVYSGWNYMRSFYVIWAKTE
ncbi:CDP-diacylglycerol/glycerol-3-phosphate 3-phosphatidyltransferase [Desulfovibrio sp. X2]|uniref:CDP-diacylglycerol--glycerol-3-phosphate 3-phosphatidyltransferase n=1 Tax=Desulfovibrio sp. X2 TaxID=941449 RepID=UPI000358B962|nr:CDP-diacylglycerol--glycerol-3-phosphate 3-phosphatidyltransferase [Desulfovibrio sp. X2]EPR42221.1 CDP-diacylglycerol/glycerol-3-phosphate 3-phosphatidyltransferase [Desulfovibrio sp. X2]